MTLSKLSFTFITSLPFESRNTVQTFSILHVKQTAEAFVRICC